jgi:hypothetical protein
MAANKGIDWSNLAQDYKMLGTQEAVAHQYGCNRSMVAQMMKTMGIPHHYDKSGSKNPKWRGGKRKDNDGYVQVYCPNHPFKTVRNEVPEHRLVMESKLGRYLEPHEIVHHKNECKDDNMPNNLELITNIAEHVRDKHPRLRDKNGRFMPINKKKKGVFI